MLADFTKVHELFDAAVSDGQIEFREFWVIGVRLAQAVGNAMDTLSDPTQFEDLVEECEGAFDQYIAPLDIVGIPAWLETRFVDPALRNQIRPILTLMAEPLLAKFRHIPAQED